MQGVVDHLHVFIVLLCRRRWPDSNFDGSRLDFLAEFFACVIADKYPTLAVTTGDEVHILAPLRSMAGECSPG